MLQEAGESELVIQIGKGLLQERLPKSFKQDIVLAMALAYVDQSRDAMAFSPPDVIRSCEMLERALKLLQVICRLFSTRSPSIVGEMVIYLNNNISFLFFFSSTLFQKEAGDMDPFFWIHV